MQTTPFNVTTVLLIAFAVLVVWTRWKGRLDSNVPLFFYGFMLVYVNAQDGRLQPWMIYVAIGLGLLLRFEFMNRKLTQLIRFCELSLLGLIIYDCTATVLAW